MKPDPGVLVIWEVAEADPHLEKLLNLLAKAASGTGDRSNVPIVINVPQGIQAAETYANNDPEPDRNHQT